MAVNKNNVVIEGLSGKVGKQLVFSQRNGHTIVSKAPAKRSKIAPSQQVQMDKFAKAVRYAKSALEDADLKQSYAEAGKKYNLSAYNMAISDFLKPAVIDAVSIDAYNGTVGSTITAKVSDNFKLTKVGVRIESSAGTTIEQGNATLKDGQWVYAATVANGAVSGGKIEVTATDTPGNITKKEVLLP